MTSTTSNYATSSGATTGLATHTTTNYNDSNGLLHRAAFVNGLGVAVLMQNDLQQLNDSVNNNACLQPFQEAMALMGQVAASCGCPKNHVNIDATTRTTIWKSFSLAKLQDDRFYVCPQALLFSVPTDASVVTQADVSFYCSVVLHNMALTHHRLAILGTATKGRSDGDHQHNIQQAQQMYEHTYRVLSTIENHHSPGDDIDMLKAVTLNNLAHIYYMTYRFKESDTPLWEIRKLCPALWWRQSSSGTTGDNNNGRNGASSSTTSLNHQIIQEIVINVFFVAGHPSVAPSA